MPRKRPPGKPAARQADPVVKITLQLPADLAKRFGVHAEMTGLNKSELFAELVKAGCRRFLVSDRGRGPGESAEAGAA